MHENKHGTPKFNFHYFRKQQHMAWMAHMLHESHQRQRPDALKKRGTTEVTSLAQAPGQSDSTAASSRASH